MDIPRMTQMEGRGPWLLQLNSEAGPEEKRKTEERIFAWTIKEAIQKLEREKKKEKLMQTISIIPLIV